MMSNAAPVAFLRDVQDKLSKRFAASGVSVNSIRQAFDANGFPFIVISENGNEAEGHPVIFIRISEIDAVSKDIFGNSTFAYAPLSLQVAYEMSAVVNEPIPALSDILVAEFESIKTGIALQLIQIANGLQVTEANVDAASPVITLDELYWPTKNP